MTEFNLGILSAYATIDDAPFNAKYPQLVAKFRALFRIATESAVGVDKVDASLAGVADSSSAASASLSRVTTSASKQAAAAARLSAAQERLNALQESGSATAKQLAAAQASVSKAQAQVAVEQGRGAAQAKVFADAQARVNATMAEYAGASKKVQQAALRVAAAEDRLNAVMTSETATTRQLAAAQASLIGAQERLAAAQTTLGQRFDRMNASALAFGRTLTHKLTTPILGIGIASGVMATRFNAQMTRIQTQAGASAQSVTDLTKSVLAMKNVQFGPQDLAAALYHLKSLGMDDAAAMRALKVGTDLAAVGGANLEDTVNALGGAWRTGIKGAQDFGKAAATVNAIIGAGNMQLPDFIDALSTGILPSAKTFGLTLKDVGSALALFTDEGVPANTAATRLRMSFSLLGAPSKAADAQLKNIGLTGLQLAQDMRKPQGLIVAISDLKDHLDQSGLSAARQSQLLSRAFGGGRSSSAILSMINNLDVLKQKQDQVDASTSKYAADVAKQRQTPQAKFAIDLANLEKAAVLLGNEILPDLVELADDATAVVRGFNDLGDGAKHFIIIMAGVAALSGPVIRLGTRILMLGGFLVRGAASAVRFAGGLRQAEMSINSMSTKSYAAGNRVGTFFSTYGAGLGIVGGSVAVFGLAGKAISDMVDAKEVAVVNSLKSAWTDLNTAVVNSKGSFSSIADQWANANIQSSGLADKAAQAGIEVEDLRKAIEGGDPAMAKLISRWKEMGDPSQQTLFLLMGLGKQYTEIRRKQLAAADAAATLAARQKQVHKAVDQVSSETNGAIRPMDRLGTTTEHTANTTSDLSIAMGDAWRSGKNLANVLQNLGGKQIAAAQAQIQFRQDLMGLKDAFDKNSSSIAGNSKAALTNRSALLGLISDAKDHAAAMQAEHVGAQKVQSTLLSNIAAIKQTAESLGVSTGQWHKFIEQIGLTPHDVKVAIHTDTYAAMLGIAHVQDAIRNINGTVIIHTQYQGGGGSTVKAYAGGGTIQGPGTSKSDSVPIMASRGEEVIQEPYASRYRSILKAINIGRFANGGTITTKTVDGKKEWVYGGQEYASLAAAQNAQARARKESHSQRMSDARSALSGVNLSQSSFSWAQFQRQLAKAMAAVQDSGATGETLAHMEKHLAAIEKQGERAERRLGRRARLQAHRLGHMVGNLDNVASSGDILGQLHNVEATLRSAGVPEKFIKNLSGVTDRIEHVAKMRNQAARHLAQANTALHNAEQKLHGDEQSFRQATIGGFDITSAGQDSNGRVTSGSLRAAQAQSLSRVRAWVSGMKKLAGKHIFPPSYLRQLAGAGPSSLPTIQALLSMGGADLAQFAANERDIAKLAGSESRVVAKRLDQGQINRDRQRVRHDQKIENRREKHLEHVVDHAMDRIGDELRHLHLLADLHFNRGELALTVKAGENDNRKRRGHHS